ncbi:hypothetical protein ACFV4F_37005, partial [Kitasatospora sp. NPDC059722]
MTRERVTTPPAAAARPLPAGAPARTGEPGARKPLIGVIGGMGPLASTELLNTVYGLEPPEHEQLAARILLWSDPAVGGRAPPPPSAGGRRRGRRAGVAR